MRVIIAGTRFLYPDLAVIDKAVADSGFQVTEVVSGGAEGVDQQGELWASVKGIPWVEYHADWRKHGKAAGPIRNNRMAQNADALILIWNGKSPGSLNMRATARHLNLPVFEVIIPKTHSIRDIPAQTTATQIELL